MAKPFVARLERTRPRKQRSAVLEVQELRSTSIGEEESDFAGDDGRMASKQYGRAQDMAVDAMQEAGDTMKRYPLSTLAIVAGLGFLFGMFSFSRR